MHCVSAKTLDRKNEKNEEKKTNLKHLTSSSIHHLCYAQFCVPTQLLTFIPWNGRFE